MWRIILVASLALLFNCHANLIRSQDAIPKQASNLRNLDELEKAAKELSHKSIRSLPIGKDEEIQKQLDAFAAKSMELQQRIDSASRSIVVIQNKKRNRNLKILNNDENNVAMVEDSERVANVADTFSACLEWLQSIPSKINCFIFGNCEENNNEDEEEGGSDEKVDSDEVTAVDPGDPGLEERK